MTSSIAGLQHQAAQTLDTLNTAGRDMHDVLTRVTACWPRTRTASIT